ncbi:flagellar hook-basal body protein [Pseudalkalibacillus berkeleyi]|uniref:Flagellar hook-basal body protein n=1 Tax=Pseudalkalibacillus berkeleyi TaxID=1069813 RepID=A0ABS9H1K9_9BACL|nr:flagellar hook-basal body protein [Pseudalkalibacillus berkeleyi]MCF6138872.1 flagellar hook-basal body protein [Pseudalkalibacillus berkeleyi]
MFRGFYTAASGMIAQQRRQDLLTNNLANVNTPGYKADQASLRAFPQMLMSRLGETNMGDHSVPTKKQLGTLATAVYMQEALPKFKQGDIQETGNRLDVALLQGAVPTDEETGTQGALFFTVQNEAGDLRMTRNGNFSVDANGNLVTSNGDFVLDTNGNRIVVGGSDFEMDSNGFIPQANAQVNVALVENPNLLEKEGNGLFRLEEEAGFGSAIGNPDVSYQLKQGFVERSNVDVEQTTVEMLNAYRTFEANQKVLQAYDRTMEKSSNEIGRLG